MLTLKLIYYFLLKCKDVDNELNSDVNDEVGSSGDKEVKDKVGYDN